MYFFIFLTLIFVSFEVFSFPKQITTALVYTMERDPSVLVSRNRE